MPSEDFIHIAKLGYKSKLLPSLKVDILILRKIHWSKYAPLF